MLSSGYTHCDVSYSYCWVLQHNLRASQHFFNHVTLYIILSLIYSHCKISVEEVGCT
jgi:hypothetical protein